MNLTNITKIILSPHEYDDSDRLLKDGIVLFFIILLTTVALYLTDILTLSISEFTIFFVSTSLLALMLSRYEKIKQESERYFERHSPELKDAVDIKTNELQEQKDMFESRF